MGDRIRDFRKLPVAISLLILAAAAGFYYLFFEHQLAYVRARNARLLAVPERVLNKTFRAGGRDLVRVFSREDSVLKVAVSRRSPPTSPDQGMQVAAFDITLSGILEGVPLGSQAFDLLLVADDKGKVIEHLGDETLVRHTLAGIVSVDGKTIDAGAFWGATQLVYAHLNDRQYALFCHPMALPHTVAGEPRGAAHDGLILCGLASRERLRRSALCLSPLVVIGLAAGVALALLTPPFIKLVLLGRSERLRFTDAYALALCVFLGLLALSVTFLDLGLIGWLRDHADLGLKATAERVRANLDAELAVMKKQLETLDREVVATGADSCSNVLALAAAPTSGCSPLSIKDLSYPYFESVAWAGADGEQTGRWSATQKPRRRFPIENREYFKAVRNNHLWPSPRRYFVEAVRSFSSGQTRAVLAIPSAGNGKPLVASISSSLISVTNTVLPPRVGFAVVDEKGDVLFHSDAAQSLTHNLFEETGDDLDLRSAVAGQASEFVQGRYWGQSHRFYTVPVSGSPWTVVAFRREDLLRAAHLEIIEGAAGLALVYAFCSYAVPSLLGLLLMKRRLGWLWPSEERRLVYAELVATLTLVGVSFVVLLRDAEQDTAVLLAFGLPWATLAAVAVAFWASPLGHLVAMARPDWRTRIETACGARFLALHLAASLLFWALYAALPGLAIMKAVADTELQALAQHEHRWRDARLKERSRAVEEFYGIRLSEDATNDKELLGKRREEGWDIYDGGLFWRSNEPVDRLRDAVWIGTFANAPGPAGWLRNRLEDARTVLPALDLESAELRHLPSGEAVPGAWIVGANGQSQFVLADSGPPDRFREVVGPWPSFWSVVGPWPLLGALVLIVLTASLIRWVARRLFLAEMARPLARHLGDIRDGVSDNAICLVPSSFEIDRFIEGGWCQRVFFHGGATPPASVDTSRPLVVDIRGFETAEKERRVAVLDYVETRLSYDDQRVCIVACSHPTDLLCGGRGSTAGPASTWPAVEVDRWLRLFGQFAPVLLREGTSPGSGDVQDTRGEQSARRLLGRSAEPMRLTRLTAELTSVDQLRRLADHHLPPAALATVSESEILDRLAEVGASYYWALWNACSPAERLALVHLCEESFVNPKQVTAVKRLLDRGVVVRDPVLRPMNESFAHFIRTNRPHEQIAELEKPEAGIGWSDLQLPLVTVASVCALFLLLFQQELLNTTMPLVSALSATGVPILVKLASVFKSLTDGRVANAPQRA